MNKIRCFLATVLLSTSISLVATPTSQAATISRLPGLNSGSTLVGANTYNLHLPTAATTGHVRLQVRSTTDTSIVMAVRLRFTAAGDYTFTFNPLSTKTQIEAADANVYFITAGDYSSLAPGTYSYTVDYVELSTSSPSGTQTLSPLTLLNPCSPGTYSTDGGIPLGVGGACLAAPANFYVASSGATSATACPADYTSPSGSDSLEDCSAPQAIVAPVTSTTAAVTSSTPSVAKGKKKSAKALAIEIGMSVPAKAKVTLKLTKASKKFCKISGSNIKGTKTGSCNVTISVKPKKGAKSIKTTSLTVS